MGGTGSFLERFVRGGMFTVAVWATVGLLALFAQAAPATDNIPTRRDLRIAMQRQDCSVFRAVERRTQSELADKTSHLNAATDYAGKAYSALLNCARSKGISSLQSDLEEGKAAEVCSQEFQAWIAPVSRLEELRSEIEEETEGLSQIQGHLTFYCGA